MKINKNITVLSCIKNCSPHVEESLHHIKEFQNLFSKVNLILAQNDSSDDTVEKINRYSSGIDLSLYNFDGLDKKYSLRTQRLAFLRNFLIKKAQNSDYIVIVDFDSVLKNFNAEGLINCFDRDLDQWDVLGANCNNRYYDLWALRTKTFNYNCWDLINHKRQEGVSDEITIPRIISKNQIKIDKNVGLIPVYSCFGGMAVYKTSITKDCSYYGLLKECECKHLNVKGSCISEISEHVPFNKQMLKNGAKIFINSELIVNCQEEHLK